MFISFFRGIGQYFDGVLVLLHRWSQRRELRYSHEGETSILICTITIVLLLLFALHCTVRIFGDEVVSDATARLEEYGMNACVPASVSVCRGYQSRECRIDQCKRNYKTLSLFTHIVTFSIFANKLWLRELPPYGDKNIPGAPRIAVRVGLNSRP